MKRRAGQGWAVAIALSLLLHAVLGRYALEEYVKEVGRRIFLAGYARDDGGTPIFYSQDEPEASKQTEPSKPAEAEVVKDEPKPEEKSLLDVIPPPEPERPPLFGEATGTGTFIQSTPGETPLEGRKASEDQAFASRDPVGRALPGEAPSPNIAPTGENGGGGGGQRTQTASVAKPPAPPVAPAPNPAIKPVESDSTDVARKESAPPESVPAPSPERVTPQPPPPAVASKGNEREDQNAPGEVGQNGFVVVRTPATGPTTRSEQTVALNTAGDGPVSDAERKWIDRARVNPLATQPVDSPSTRPVDPTWRTKPDSTIVDATTKPTERDEEPAPKAVEVALADEYLKPVQAQPEQPADEMPTPPTPAAEQTPPAPPQNNPGPGGAPGVAAPSADLAPQTDSEVDPFTKMGFVTFKPGRADVKFGRKIKTTRPQLLLAGQWASITLSKRSVQVGIRIDATGKVTNVDIVRGSGTNDIDLPIQRAIYDWWIEPIKDRFGTIPPSDLIFLDINVVG